MLTTIRQGKGYYIRATSGEGLTPKEKYEELQINVCKATGILIEDLKSRCRDRELVIARQICIYIGRMNGLGSHKFLAYGVGLINHSTSIHAIQMVNDLIQANDTMFLNSWNQCKHLLRA
jgi:chromosomal replication initiation ATPase DnaA